MMLSKNKTKQREQELRLKLDYEVVREGCPLHCKWIILVSQDVSIDIKLPRKLMSTGS